jgi:hypothetical protein
MHAPTTQAHPTNRKKESRGLDNRSVERWHQMKAIDGGKDGKERLLHPRCPPVVHPSFPLQTFSFSHTLSLFPSPTSSPSKVVNLWNSLPQPPLRWYGFPVSVSVPVSVYVSVPVLFPVSVLIPSLSLSTHSQSLSQSHYQSLSLS